MPVFSATFPVWEVVGSLLELWCKTFVQNVGNEERAHNVLHFFLKNIETQVAWFLAELCKAEKRVQKDKGNQYRTELVRGCLGPASTYSLWSLH